MAIEICKDEYIKSKKDTKSKSSEIRKVNILDIVKAYDSMSNSKVVNVLKSLRSFEIVVVIALMITNVRVEKVELQNLRNECDFIINDIKLKGL
jgi:hypothetical protein